MYVCVCMCIYMNEWMRIFSYIWLNIWMNHTHTHTRMHYFVIYQKLTHFFPKGSPGNLPLGSSSPPRRPKRWRCGWWPGPAGLAPCTQCSPAGQRTPPPLPLPRHWRNSTGLQHPLSLLLKVLRWPGPRHPLRNIRKTSATRLSPYILYCWHLLYK